MSTPESDKLIQNVLHSGGAIRKSLLTPYRRIGLSRNRQTSHNKSFVSPLQSKEPVLIDTITSFSPVNQRANEECKNKSVDSSRQGKLQVVTNNLSVNTVHQNTSETVCTTPIIHSKKLISPKIKQYESKKSRDSTKIKEKSLKNKDKQERKISGKDNQEEKDKKLSEANSVKTIVEEESNLSLIETLQSAKNDKHCKNVESTNFEVSEVGLVQANTYQSRKKTKLNKDHIESIYSYVNDHDYTVCKANNMQENILQNGNQCEAQEVTNSMRKTPLNPQVIVHKLNDDKLSNKIDNLVQAPYVILENMHTEPVLTNNSIIINTANEETTYNAKSKEKSRKSFKRKLSLRKSISCTNLSQGDEISNTITDQDNSKVCIPKDSSKTVDEIIELEKIVENKEDELHRLQQVQIYRNKHKIEDLKVDTNVWKSGCQDALRDLLSKLNEHSTIDMNGLLTRLKAPKDLITYDFENDSFL